jgi:hypothetical protein
MSANGLTFDGEASYETPEPLPPHTMHVGAIAEWSPRLFLEWDQVTGVRFWPCGTIPGHFTMLLPRTQAYVEVEIKPLRENLVLLTTAEEGSWRARYFWRALK